MAFRYADNVKETTTTTGTGAYSLAGAVAGSRIFVAGIGNGNLCEYSVSDGTNWETGFGTVTDGSPDTLARTLVLSSSNSDAAVNWGAGTKTVWCGPIAGSRNPRSRKLASDHTNSTVTGTEVTGLELTNLVPGTYVATYYLIQQGAATTTGVALGINFTGTAALKTIMRRNVATITTASNGLAEEESGAALKTGGVLNGWASKTYSTTTPNMVSDGVGALNADTFDIIEVLVVVTALGNLELWAASEVASSQITVKAGSSVILQRIDD